MKKTKKIVALFLAAVMLVCTTVAATVAYLTANTGVVTNTFTVGKVEIDLLETDVDEYGTDITQNLAVKTNEYKLVPGHNYMKDPTVIVKKGSEKSYVFIKVTNGISAIESSAEGYTNIAGQIASNGWTQLVDVNGEEVENVYYKENVDAREAEQKLAVFGEFTLKTDANVAGYATATIKIDAYAVQADGFGTAAAAWDAAAGTFEN